VRRAPRQAVVVQATPLTWVVRILWLSLPATLGDLLGGAAADRSPAVGAAVAVGAWVVWAVGLVALLVQRPLALVVLRVVLPVAPVAAVVAATQGMPDLLGWSGLATASVAAALALSAEVGDGFVGGGSYGDERRFALRPPAVLVLGPVPVLWALMVGPLAGGVLLLAARSWVAGAVAVAGGVACAAYGMRTLGRLVRRCAVLVPAGLTLVDDLALSEPTLFRRDRMARLGPAPTDTTALDLTAGATGLILEVTMTTPVSLVPAVRRGAVGEAVEATSVLFTPSRPGAMLAVAETRRLAVGRS
jgi:hypothetical protein